MTEQAVLFQLKQLPDDLKQEALDFIAFLFSKHSLTKQAKLDTQIVSSTERKRRVAVVRKFRGALKNKFQGYQPSKQEWYEQ